ncbi:MAG TPA: SDR family NAD(P)-dependent oxidoreductase [Myxococcales bacterium]|nr:SDR family NAD(P)-dependent oxidoreductase [Myxococcales bacterium]
MSQTRKKALIVGVGPGLSASVARKLFKAGYGVALAARDIAKLAGLAKETQAEAFACDATQPEQVERLFAQAGAPDVVIFNAAGRARGPIASLKPEEVREALMANAFAAFLVGQAAAKVMTPRGTGTILFTGASASVKGFAGSAPFAMGKFAVRGLSQSLARELGPKGIHVAHVIIDGGIRSEANPNPPDQPDSRLEPDAIADVYLHLIAQHRSAWTHEVDLRAWTEPF